MNRPLVHLIRGGAGAGKTTYAMDLAWIWARVERCERQIQGVAVQLGGRGTTAILDLSFQRSEQRRIVTEHCRDTGFGVRLHWLDVDPHERWRWVSARNAAKGETFALTVTRQMFGVFEARYEPPTPEELIGLNGFRVELPNP
jgi:predicted kinase